MNAERDEYRSKVAALGARFDASVSDATRALYRAGVAPPAAGTRVSADAAYGPDPRQTLDLYVPGTPNGAALLYVPGGGFVGGDKNGDGVFYANVGHHFAAHGFLTATMNHRLAPAHPWPAGAEDVAAALAWLRASAGAGSPMFLFGQSAGASHAASFLFDPHLALEGRAEVTAAVLMSGLYRIAADAPPNVRAYFGEDAGAYAARSPLTHAANGRVPLLLSVAEFDPAPLAAPTFELAAAITRRDGRSPRLAWFGGHNHVSTVLSIGSTQDDVGAAIRAFLDDHLEGRSEEAAA